MTIREIAAECGVSVATVDRVINGRGKVRPDTEARILAVLERAGYTKNIAARALAIRKGSPTIGVMISSEGNPFFDEVLAGIRRAEVELMDFGVSVAMQTMRGYEPVEQLRCIDLLAPDISALVLHPIDDPRIVQKIAELSKKGIPTVTVNSDLEHSQRRCYVGSDYVKGGQTAAGLMRLATHGKRRLGILTGVETMLGHRQRLRGFEHHLRATCPRIDIVARRCAEDDDGRAYEATRDMLRTDPLIDTLQLIAAGLRGVCDAIAELGLDKRVRLFAFDNIPTTVAAMERGLLKAVVCQQPFQQGYQSVRSALDIILSGSPVSERIIMENRICIRENL
ncbi:MAG: LacI family DNA-binding transcriptional regulator [Clostridia bacterium]|nr:LacI family DNA-binding transcriptional regulator [Clostridia bacterium]